MEELLARMDATDKENTLRLLLNQREHEVNALLQGNNAATNDPTLQVSRQRRLAIQTG